MGTSIVACSLCGRSLAETGYLSGDSWTGNCLCGSCERSWSPETYRPTDLIIGVSPQDGATSGENGPTAAVGLTADLSTAAGQGPLAARLDHFVWMVPVSMTAMSGQHEVRLTSVDLFDDGFVLRLAARPRQDTVPTRDSAGTGHPISELAVEVSDDLGGRYWCVPAPAEVGAGRQSEGEIRCVPPPRPEAGVLSVRVAVHSASAGVVPAESVIFKVPLDLAAPASAAVGRC